MAAATYDIDSFGSAFYDHETHRIWVTINWSPPHDATEEEWHDDYANAKYGLMTKTSAQRVLRDSWKQMMISYTAAKRELDDDAAVDDADVDDVVAPSADADADHVVVAFGEVYYDIETKLIWLEVFWSGDVRTDEEFTDQYREDRWGKKDETTPRVYSTWNRMMRQYKKLLVTLGNEQDLPVDGVDYGDRLIIMDLEWHLDTNGPISQIACTSMDGKFESNYYIKGRRLHKSWRKYIDSHVVTLSAWDDQSDTSSIVTLFAALKHIFRSVPTGAIFIYHGKTDRNALLWGIDNQIDNDDDRQLIKDLVVNKKIKFASTSTWLSQQYEYLNIRDHILPVKKKAKVGAVAHQSKGEGRLNVIYRNVFVERPDVTDDAEGEEYVRDNIDLSNIEPLLADMIAGITYPAQQTNTIRYTMNKRWNRVLVVFHEAGTDVTALKLVLLVIAFVLHAYKSRLIKPVAIPTDTNEWQVVRAVARALGNHQPGDVGLFGCRVIASPVVVSATMWLYFNAATNNNVGFTDNKNTKARHNKTKPKDAPQLHLNAERLRFINNRASVYKHTVRNPKTDIIQGDTVSLRQPGAVLDSDDEDRRDDVARIESGLTALLQTAQRNWIYMRDEPIYMLGPRGEQPDVVIVHCKHCPTLLIRSKAEVPALKPQVHAITLLEHHLLFKYVFCKICKKYEGDRDDCGSDEDDDVNVASPIRHHHHSPDDASDDIPTTTNDSVADEPEADCDVIIGNPSDAFSDQWSAMLLMTILDHPLRTPLQERIDRLYEFKKYSPEQRLRRVEIAVASIRDDLIEFDPTSLPLIRS